MSRCVFLLIPYLHSCPVRQESSSEPHRFFLTPPDMAPYYDLIARKEVIHVKGL